MEYFALVDKEGNPTGEIMERSEVHRTGAPHRTAHVWLLRRNGGRLEILLQKRCQDKDSYPGCYDISSAGHIPAGCGYLESAKRELQEELGIVAEEPEFIPCGKKHVFIENVFYGNKFVDNQTSFVFLMWKNIEAEDILFQQSEIESVRWFEFGECIKAVKEHTIPNCIDLEELQMLRDKLFELGECEIGEYMIE